MLEDPSVCSVLLRELFVSPGVGGSSAEREGDAVASRIGGGRRFAEVASVITAANEAAAGNFAPLMVILSGEGTAGTKTGGAPFADGCMVADRRFARTVIARAFPLTETRFTT